MGPDVADQELIALGVQLAVGTRIKNNLMLGIRPIDREKYVGRICLN